MLIAGPEDLRVNRKSAAALSPPSAADKSHATSIADHHGAIGKTGCLPHKLRLLVQFHRYLEAPRQDRDSRPTGLEIIQSDGAKPGLPRQCVLIFQKHW